MESVWNQKGKALLVVGIALMWLLILTLFKELGYYETWKLWKVPATKEMAFWDFRLIPGGAESFRNGFEPSVENPFDPGKRKFNYPAFWRLFFYTDITQQDTDWIVPLSIFLLFVTAILFPRDLSILGALGMLLVLFSPAAMLLYERGNADLIVFPICVFALLALDVSAYLAMGILLFGAVVKMFPFFGLTIFLREPQRRFLFIVLASVLFIILYSLLTLNSQLAAWNSTDRSGDKSYGSFVFASHFHNYLPNLLTFYQWRDLFGVAALLLILLSLVLAIVDRQPLRASNERNLAAFRMGASIYIGTFMLGNSWDYRLVFLVLVVPQLVEWFWSLTGRHRAIAISTMICVLLSCWYLFLKIDLPMIPFKDPLNRSFVFDEMINWLLLVEFAYLLMISSPDWLREFFQRMFGFLNRDRYQSESAI